MYFEIVFFFLVWIEGEWIRMYKERLNILLLENCCDCRKNFNIGFYINRIFVYGYLIVLCVIVELFLDDFWEEDFMNLVVFSNVFKFIMWIKEIRKFFVRICSSVMCIFFYMLLFNLCVFFINNNIDGIKVFKVLECRIYLDDW